MNKEIMTKTAMLMMGIVIEENSFENVDAIVECLAKELKITSARKTASACVQKYCPTATPCKLSLRTIYDQEILTIALVDIPDGELTEHLGEQNDITEYLGYAYNFRVPEFSELGYVYFQKGINGMLHQI